MEYYYNNISKIRSASFVFENIAIIFQDGKKNWIHMDSKKSTISFHMIIRNNNNNSSPNYLLGNVFFVYQFDNNCSA